MLGVTIAAITGSENAMEKAQDARIKNDEGAMKDAAALKATNFIQEYYNKVYVENDDTTKTNFNNTGEYVIAQFDDLSTESGFTYDISDTNKLRVSDLKGNSVTGTILDNGNIEWNSTSASNNNNNNNQSGGTTYTAYEVGDTITITSQYNGSNQNFYVIADSDENTSTVKLLAKHNLDVDEVWDDEGEEIVGYEQFQSQTPDYYTDVAFDDDSTVYAGSEIEGVVNAYVDSLGLNGATGRLLLLSDLESLGLYYDQEIEDYNIDNCPYFIRNIGYYWLGTAMDNESVYYLLGNVDQIQNVPFNESRGNRCPSGNRSS